MQPASHNPELKDRSPGAPFVSLAIFAWNEEKAIPRLLNSLFEQSLFAHLRRRNLSAEIICVLNGCTDASAQVANVAFAAAAREHPDRAGFSARVENLSQRGKINAWNQYVHSLSARGAQFLIMMDADIVIHPKDTLLRMLSTLEKHSGADVAVDQPCKDILLKKEKSVPDRLSLGMSRMTKAADGQLCGQLYCIRSAIARKIYLPRDLPACEDGFIKALVCTEFLAHDVEPRRIKVADGAFHTFEAYTSPRDILKNQKRQIIGQTAVHVLVDRHLKSLPPSARADLAGTLRQADETDPLWLKRLIASHLKETRFFWRLYPDLLNQRFKNLARLDPLKRILCSPAAAASVVVGALSAFSAWKTLKSGTLAYWPKANRAGIKTSADPVPTQLSYSTLPNHD